MKLLRYGAAGAEQPGLFDSDGNIRDLSEIVNDIDGESISGENGDRFILLAF